MSTTNDIMIVPKPNNRNLFIYWEQGWDQAPLICKKCLQSWEKIQRRCMEHHKVRRKHYTPIPRHRQVGSHFLKDNTNSTQIRYIANKFAFKV